MSKLFLKAALAVGALVSAVGGAEIALRIAYPSLPSLAALEGSDLQIQRFPSGCPIHGEMKGESIDHWVQHMMEGNLKPLRESRRDRVCWEPSYLESSGGDSFTQEGAFRLAVAGDSVVDGVGAAPGTGVVDALERRLGSSLGRPVEALNLGHRGAGYCAVFSRAMQALEQGADALVVVVFGDDLEDRAMVALDGSVVAFPDRIDGDAKRLLASYSYLVNLWWFVDTQRASAQQDGEPRRFIDPEGRAAFTETVERLIDAAEASDTPLQMVLLAPVGMYQCDPEPTPMSRCDWIPRDLDLMAEMLDRAGADYLDLRALWDGHDDMLWSKEMHELEPGGMVVHPSYEGHTHLAEAILPALLERLESH